MSMAMLAELAELATLVKTNIPTRVEQVNQWVLLCETYSKRYAK
jgi:hypothetical protein